jgi:hypothetical protein
MRAFFLKRRERALNYRACGQSMISAGSNVAPSRKDILHVVQRTRQSFVILLSIYSLTRQGSELFLSITDCGYRNWTLPTLRITFEDKLEMLRMLGTWSPPLASSGFLALVKF